ncbi:MAG TPA: ATP-dependent DNA helicase RecG [Dongiaceae bacterium]|nr:ATP-dependent DNA helicase RecG [Dongiaceae bacterium]
MRPPKLFPLFAEIVSIPGVGPRFATLFAKLNISRIVHLLWHLPINYVDRRPAPPVAEAEPGKVASFLLDIHAHHPARRAGLPYRITAGDKSGNIELVFFNVKGDYLLRQLPPGQQRAVSGRVELFRGVPSLAHPDIVAPAQEFAQIRRIDPIYGATAGLPQKVIRKAVAAALDRLPDLAEWLESDAKARHNWDEWRHALLSIHRPESSEDCDPVSAARNRLAYDELLASQMALALLREQHRHVPGRAVRPTQEIQRKIRDTLPYRLTQAQESALAEILDDLQAPRRMVRLLQGDVGSGKTVVAALALAAVIEDKGQGALLAPTDILARQHYGTLEPLMDKASIRTMLVTGRERGTKAGEQTLHALASGTVDLIVGTHALLQDDVAFKDLRLAIIDEQHRFGVAQRLALARKGASVDLLLMTATPIPRTLLMAAYGDIDVSRIAEKPAGRQPIDTRLISLSRLDSVIAGLKRAVQAGARIYWVCPLVEESDTLDLAAAKDRFETLRPYFRAAIVHGKQKPAERDSAIADFAAGRVDLLVATTVIEVGVNIPEATVMVVEHAERFGLAQLHQLRGRIGRGSDKSTCLLLYQEPLNAVASARLSVLRESDDGFRIAEEDLRLRGGGEVLGHRQSGLPVFRLADLALHGDLLTQAQSEAHLLARQNPRLTGIRGEALRHLLYLFERDEAIRTLHAG